jgi:hypothetical protein
MSLYDTSLFASAVDKKIGVGFHNIGSGVLRASNPLMVHKVEAHYGERCGHIPLLSQQVRILVTEHTPDIHAQIAYLSDLFGKEMQAATATELREEQQRTPEIPALVVPYINVPETEQWIQSEFASESWGLPGKMVSLLKNKADFYTLLDEYDLPGFQAPEYRITDINSLQQAASEFLTALESLYTDADLVQYPLGLMLRASESDGNYGCCLLYELNGLITLVPNGDVELTRSYTTWAEGLEISQQVLLETMDLQKETRVVMSRYIEFADSPGMSMVIMQGHIESLRWNGQLQKAGSKACIGTGNYQPKDNTIARLQQTYEDQTIACFERLLKQTARKCQLDFASLHGVANIDIMVPGPLEEQLQRQRGQKPMLYVAECNPRWTNYTDAILSILGANRKEPTINNMRTTIQERLQAIDKYELPEQVDPRHVRDRIVAKDLQLKKMGTRIICRMTQKPLGVIFAGDIEHAQQELADIVQTLA